MWITTTEWVFMKVKVTTLGPEDHDDIPTMIA
jgi:hypothetical protein